MGGLKLIYRLRARLKRRPQLQLDVKATDHGFAIKKVRKLIFSYQDGGAPALWFPEDANLAAELGHLQLMKTMKGVKSGQIFLTSRNLKVSRQRNRPDYAAANGYLPVVQWLHDNRREGCTVSAMNWAAENGHLSVVQFLHHNRQETYVWYDMTQVDTPYAERTLPDRLFDLLSYRHEGCTTAAFDRAAMNNHVHVIMWLTDNRSEGGTESALQWAMVALLLAPRKDSDSEGVALQTRGSNTSVTSIKSLDSLGLGLDSPTLSIPHGKGHFRFNCSKFAMDKAAQGGHIDVLQLLHDQGHECTTNAMDWAAAFGKTETVKWLSENREEGCTKDAIDHAAAGGHLETVQWLHENRREGCTRFALTDAAGNGHMETVKWLHRNRPEGCGRRAMDDAAANGHVKMVRWLYDNRCDHIDDTPENSSSHPTAACEGCRPTYFIASFSSGGILDPKDNSFGSLPSVPQTDRLAVDSCYRQHPGPHRSPALEGCSREAMERAARNGHLEVVKLLHDRGATCTSTAVHLAQVHGHHGVYRFLNAMYPGKASPFDAFSDPTVVAEQEMVDQDKSLDLVVQREARRRRQSVIFADTVEASESRRRASLPIPFGHNGKPALSRINTFAL
ncbi:unnamed protein product [Ectocarpus sp. CCAP 1310/34]|nr:unnamed protein product [Ectocarpus sp. CCAP 1310/34]